MDATTVTNREKQFFEQALDLDPEKREEFLAKVCAGDPALLQRITALLQANDAVEDFLPAAPINGPAGANATVTERAGDRIGRYKLLQKIGEGGCGVVYMAEQEEPVRRRVALKIIKLGMDTRSVVARFEAERQALAMMDHPNIARVFDAGVTEVPLTRPSATLAPGGGEGRGEGESAESQIANRQLVIQSGRPYFVME